MIDDSIVERIIKLELRIEQLERNVLNDIEKEIPSRLDNIKNEIINIQDDMIEKSINTVMRRSFLLMGVDIEDQKSIQQFRDDLRFGGIFKDAAQKGFMAFLAAIFGGLGLSILLFFKEKFGFK